MNANPAKFELVAPSADTELTEPQLSIVIPLFNEAQGLAQLFTRLESVTGSLALRTEVILVDDGSQDSTWLDITHYAPENFHLNCIALSRNFGKEAALTSGLHAVRGEVVLILDADCQDPPELLPRMLERWQDGADIVNMQRRSREGETWLKRKSASLFYRLFGLLSEVPIPPNVGDFRLLSRRVVDEINRLGERNRYMKGLLAWPGFNQVTLEYDRQPRVAGNSNWNYWQLYCLAIAGITGFSNKPLRIASWMGTLVAASAFVYGLWVLVRTLIYGDPVSGYPSLMLVMLFLGGVQLTTIGILGEYVGRIFTEVKNRPSYIVREARFIEADSAAQQMRSA